MSCLRNLFWTLMIIVAFAGLLAAAFLIDVRIVEFWQQPIRSGQTKAFLIAMRAWGEAPTLLVIVIAIGWAAPSLRGRMVRTVLCALVCAGMVDLLKPIFGRQRPAEVRIEAGGAMPTWQGGGERNSSFPSGHTATAFSFGRSISLVFPSLRPICLLAASGTAASRMYEQRHFLSDCVAGAAIGWFGTWVLWWLLGKSWHYGSRLRANIASRRPPDNPVTGMSYRLRRS